MSLRLISVCGSSASVGGVPKVQVVGSVPVAGVGGVVLGGVMVELFMVMPVDELPIELTSTLPVIVEFVIVIAPMELESAAMEPSLLILPRLAKRP